MTGGHRSTIQSPITSARKSAAWLITGAGLLAVLLALLGLLIYLAVAYPSVLLRVFGALPSGAVALYFGNGLARRLLRKRTP